MRYRFDGPLTAPRRSFWSKAISVVLASLVLWTPALVYAQDPDGEYADYGQAYESEAVAHEAPSVTETHAGLGAGEYADPDAEPVGAGAVGDLAVDADGLPLEEGAPSVPVDDPSVQPLSLPSGTNASAATPQAISLPDAEGSVEGMGESFSPVLSSGTATFSVPIAVAPGRAGVQPSLSLSYSSTGGNGPVGFGWNLAVPFISRQSDRGLPHYIDGPAYHAEEDRFMYNGGQELVPVDGASAAEVDQQADPNGPDAALVPTEVSGWQQYRARVEGGFMRFFRSPDSERWVVQSKDGTWFEFGQLVTGPTEAIAASSDAVERDPEASAGGVARWCLTRMSDAHGSSVYYLYDQDEGRSYLRDIYYVSPASCASATPRLARECTAALDGYAARVSLGYDASREDTFASYATGWRVGTSRRLSRVTVTAYSDAAAARTLVRRYHLGYDASTFHSLLSQVQVEGRPNVGACATPGSYCVGDDGVRESTLSSAVVGELLPPMRFSYSTMPSGGVAGFGGVDATVRAVAHSPPHSVDEQRADLFDVNSDGLPDLIVTDPARYRTASGAPAVGVFFNGFSGRNAEPASAGTFSDAVAVPMSPGLSSVLSLSNANVVPMDIDGDGRSDLLHMPRQRTYGWWAPTRTADPLDSPTVSPADQGWAWTYARIDLPAGDTDPRIDLGRDSGHMQALDVNNDHLVDIVRTTGTVMQTWLNLGWLPGGDGRFGSYRHDGAGWVLSTQPVESCLLQSGLPLDFDDPEVRIADLNGDGLQDLVQLRRGRVRYWPGRGEGVFGIGPRRCARGEGDHRYIDMASAPMELSPELDNVFLTDVNMDGASDLVQVRFREVDVWFNRAGNGWTSRTIARGTPAAPGFAPRIRMADIDGSSTTDIVWANGGRWEYIDPSGGQRPRLLTGVDNGLGADTTITYGSSAEDYLADLRDAVSCSSCERFAWSAPADAPDARLCQLSQQQGVGPCDAADTNRDQWLVRGSGSPVVSTVVRSVSTTDRMDALGRAAQVSLSEFAYHDGYYEGIEQEFRGFGAADAVSRGDWNNPTVWSRTRFHQGRRPASIADDRLADNPFEALKGREYLTEVFDEAGAYLSTSFATLTDRHLLTGLDGTEIHYAFVSETNELRYDTSPWTPPTGAPTELTLSEVVRETVTGGVISAPTVESTRDIVVRADLAHTSRIRGTFELVDNVGLVHVTNAHGRVDVATGASVDQIHRDSMVPVLLNNGGQWIWREEMTNRGVGLADPAGMGTFGYTTRAYYDDGDPTYTIVTPFNASPPVAPSYAFGADPAGEGGALGHTHAIDTQYASSAHDHWGQPLASCGGSLIYNNPTIFHSGCLRYGRVAYDAEFQQVATSESIAIGRVGASPELLTTTASWDRGLGAILTATDPNALTTEVSYDGLGRLTSVTPPNAAGCTGAHEATTIRYELTSSPSAQPLSRVITTTELECDGTLGETADTLVSVAYVDGLGRARAALSTNGDGTSAWVRSGITTLDQKGSVRRSYQAAFFNGSETDYRAVVSLPAVPYAVTRYDAFGRARGVIAEDGSVTWTSYHSLSTDVCDPLDNDPSSAHYRTCTTAVTDGHGRVIDQILRNRDPGSGAAQTHRLWTYYRGDDAVMALIRAQSTGARPSTWTSAIAEPHVVRTFTYDTLGRRLSSDDPDTDNGADASETTNSWRYLYNKVNDLVAVRDPRGCGQNFFYDHAGRLRGEQYVGCGEAQTSAAETPPASNSVSGLIAMAELSGSVSLDTVYHYDEYPGWASPPLGLSGTQGRATGVTDRGQRAAVGYDDRGHAVWTSRQLALIPSAPLLNAIVTTNGRPSQTEQAATAGAVVYDAAHTYERTASFDHAGRPTSMALPTDPDYAGTAPAVGGTLTYNARGLPSSALLTLDASSVTIVEAISYLRDGLVSSVTYGDDLSGTRTPTTSTTAYDARRRPVRMTTTRTPLTGHATGNGEELEAVTAVFDQQLVWDAANNLVRQVDHRDPGEWPAGFRPQSVDITHDALYRVVGADYEYTQADGSRTTVDSATDWRTQLAESSAAAVDPMNPQPAPLVSSAASARVVSLTWEWDYLANTTEWTDDQRQFYERSIGDIANGNDLDSAERPSALYLSSDISGGTGGWLEVDYGVGGNVTAMTVHGQCTNNGGATCADPGGASLASRLSALRADCTCAVEQHYAYRWDELNRIVEARRYDGSAGGGWSLEARERYRYDGANQRVVKQSIEQDSCLAPPVAGSGVIPCERTALYPYPGDFERRGLYADGAMGSYEPTGAGTETQYVVAGARVVWANGSPGTAFDRDARVTVPMADLIQTSAAVFDVRTGALLEASTYYPNGGRETFLNDDTGLVAAEPSGFTGKEADEEVGVVYFGERWLIPRLGRWASPDPLHVHAVGGGEALNSFHYVGGNLLLARDPIGLLKDSAVVSALEASATTAGGEGAGAAIAQPAAGATVVGLVVAVLTAVATTLWMNPASVNARARGSGSVDQQAEVARMPQTAGGEAPVASGAPMRAPWDPDYFDRHPGEWERFSAAMANGEEFTPLGWDRPWNPGGGPGPAGGGDDDGAQRRRSYRWDNPNVVGNRVAARLTSESVLELEIYNPNPGHPSAVRGTDLLDAAIHGLGGTDRIRAIEGFWLRPSSGERSDNYNAYMDAVDAGATPEAAARSTWTGRRAAERGFTEVHVRPTGGDRPHAVVATFTRPSE